MKHWSGAFSHFLVSDSIFVGGGRGTLRNSQLSRFSLTKRNVDGEQRAPNRPAAVGAPIGGGFGVSKRRGKEKREGTANAAAGSRSGENTDNKEIHRSL